MSDYVNISLIMENYLHFQPSDAILSNCIQTPGIQLMSKSVWLPAFHRHRENTVTALSIRTLYLLTIFATGTWRKGPYGFPVCVLQMHYAVPYLRFRHVFAWSFLEVCCMSANSKGSCETMLMRRLAWAFAARSCDKYPFLMCWLICQKKLKRKKSILLLNEHKIV